MPQRRHVARPALTAVAATACLAFATPAWASSTVPLNPAHQGSTAAGFNQECNDGRFAGREANQDGWHFVLPGASAGNFETLTLTFSNGAAQVQVKIPDATDAYPDHLYSTGGKDPRTIHAYLFTPAGWTLVDGSAVISGTAARFNLSHTCAGGTTPSQSPSPSPSPSESESPNPSESPSESESPNPSESPSESESPVPSESATTPGVPGESESPTGAPSESATVPGAPGSSVGGGVGGGDEGGLPLTGVAATSIAVTGLALIGGGVVLMTLRRRRDKVRFTS
ncbi:LPXTG cell wall anchor domain-containing protein [Micromonospora sp. PLK6-60]|nr:LPXTG cell wall anchor domain-containing protein [Micromonospora sp. PLK6-60]MBY8871252.1 LPXTG cell wall anchor domain-containing protein [Micromonospora sp. PLK6-60]